MQCFQKVKILNTNFMKQLNKKLFSTIIRAIILLTFLVGQILTGSLGQAQGLQNLTLALYQPPVLLGLKVHPENPLLFDFIVDRGEDKLSDGEFKAEAQKLIEYFFAALTIPDKQVWVNLSPYEKDRIIPDVLGKTQMGKTMLEQDYVLKQLAASLTNPDTDLGRKYWDEVHRLETLDARRWTLGKTTSDQPPATSDQPPASNDLNKVWIIPAKAKVLESNGIVVVDEKRLKVMMADELETTLVARRSTLEKNTATNLQPLIPNHQPPTSNATEDREATSEGVPSPTGRGAHISTQVFRQLILPKLIEEVNTGKNFAAVRQVYNAVILAAWYKQALKESLLAKIYTDKAKVAGIETDDKEMKQRIYEQYLAAFKKGAYNFIKEEDDAGGDLIPRKYFSGGITTEFGQVAGSALEVQAVSSAAVFEPISRTSASIVTVQGEERASAGVVAANLSANAASPTDSGSKINNLYRPQFSNEFLDEPRFGLEQLEKVYLGSFAGEMAVALAQGHYLNHSQGKISFSGKHFMATIREKNYELRQTNKIFEGAVNKVFAVLQDNPELAKKYQKEIAEVFAGYFWQVYHLARTNNESLDPSVDLTTQSAIRGIQKSDKEIAILGAGLQGFVAMTEYADKKFLLVDQNPFIIFSLAKYKELTKNPSRILEVDFTSENFTRRNGLQPIFDRVILSRVLHEAGRTYVAPDRTEGNLEGEVKINSLEAQRARERLIKNSVALLRLRATVVVREVLDSPEIPYTRQILGEIKNILLPLDIYKIDLNVGEVNVPNGNTVVSVAGIVGTIQRASSSIASAEIDAAAKKIVGTLATLERFKDKISNLPPAEKGSLENLAALLLTKALPPFSISNPTIGQLDVWAKEQGIKGFSTAEGVLFVDKILEQYFGYQFENGLVSLVPQVFLQEIKKLSASTPSADKLAEEPQTVGGINFDPTLLNLQIKRDSRGVPLPLPEQNIENINIDGLYPLIINM